MTSEVIEQFVQHEKRKGTPVNIHFKERSTVKGLFIDSGDYAELKYKNLWRIISAGKLDEWHKTKNLDLSRIFNGLSFTRLSDES